MTIELSLSKRASFGLIVHALQDEGCAYLPPLLEPAITDDGTLVLVGPEKHCIHDEADFSFGLHHHVIRAIAIVLKPRSHRASVALQFPNEHGTDVFYDDSDGWLRLSPEEEEQAIDVLLDLLQRNLQDFLDEADWERRQLKLPLSQLLQNGALTFEHLEDAAAVYEKKLRDVAREHIKSVQDGVDEHEANDQAELETDG